MEKICKNCFYYEPDVDCTGECCLEIVTRSVYENEVCDYFQKSLSIIRDISSKEKP